MDTLHEDVYIFDHITLISF